MAVYQQGIAVQADIARKAAEGGVEAGEVGEGALLTQVIDRGEVDLLLQFALEQRAHQAATDTSISIDSNAQHNDIPLAVFTCSLGQSSAARLIYLSYLIANRCARRRGRRSPAGLAH